VSYAWIHGFIVVTGRCRQLQLVVEGSWFSHAIPDAIRLKRRAKACRALRVFKDLSNYEYKGR
jgi:hypothetical protein